MMRSLAFAFVALAVFADSAAATAYTVKAGGGGNFTTIQGCENAPVVAGDSCTVFAGTYNETPSLTRAGTAGSPITFTVNPGDTVQVYSFVLDADYNTINGFLITDPSLTHGSAGIDVPHSHTGDQITNNTITQVGALAQACINTHANALVSFMTISGNTVSWCHAVPGQSNALAQTGIEINGDHFLVQNNAISHTNNGMSGDEDHSFIIGNSYGPVNVLADFPGCLEAQGCDQHVDFIEAIPSAGTRGFLVIENNTSNNLLGYQGAHAPGILESTGTNAIIRYNTASNVGESYLVDTGTWTFVKDYNNTAYTLGTQMNEVAIINLKNSSTNGAVLNDLYDNVMTPLGGNYLWYTADATSLPTLTSGFNLLYDSVCTNTCSYQGRAATDAGNVKGQDPLFINGPFLDFRLQPGSPALNAGTHLTTVAATDTGSGTSLIVNDAAYFQDGYGVTGVSADCVAVTTVTNHVCVTAVNYGTNTLTLAAGITRAAGDSVWLYADAEGTVVLTGSAPNIGAKGLETQFGAPMKSL